MERRALHDDCDLNMGRKGRIPFLLAFKSLFFSVFPQLYLHMFAQRKKVLGVKEKSS